MFRLFRRARKHKLNISSAFESKKSAYRTGEKVTVYYKYIATDTNYSFSSPDVEIKLSYEDKHGYILEFTMPDHDVTLNVSSYNSMVDFISEPEDEKEENDFLTFHSFDGGGPGFDVQIEDEDIASYTEKIEYYNPDHAKMCGSGFDVIIKFKGIKPGETAVLIKERSPIAGNFDHLYTIYVNDKLKVSVVHNATNRIFE